MLLQFWQQFYKFLALSRAEFDSSSMVAHRWRLARQPSNRGCNSIEKRAMSSYKGRQVLSRKSNCTKCKGAERSNIGWGLMLNSLRSISPWVQNSSAISWLTCWWTFQGLVAAPKSAAVIIPACNNCRFCLSCWTSDEKVSADRLIFEAKADSLGAILKCKAKSVARMLRSMTAKVSAYSS